MRLLLSLPSDVPLPTCGLSPGTWNHVFTDGSCFHSSQPLYRLAAWSVVTAPVCDALWSPGQASVMCASYLPGLCQTAFRAELFAVAFVLHWAAVFQAPVQIWTDCQGVVFRFYNYIWGNRKINHNRSNSDLWWWISDSVNTLGRNNVRFHKVAAHKQISLAQSREEAWQFFHNDYADRAARLANQTRPPEFWSQWEAHVAAVHAAATLYNQVLAVHLAVGRRQVRSVQVPAPVVSVPKPVREFPVGFDVGSWNGGIPPGVARQFGTAHARRAAHWLKMRFVAADESSIQWISFVQLYIDFQLSWGNPGPLVVQQQWIDVETRPFLAAENHPFRRRVRWFRRFLKAFWAESGIKVELQQCKPKSDVVMAFLPAASVPWDSRSLQHVDHWIMKHVDGPCARGAEILQKLPLATKDGCIGLNLP